MAEVVPEVRIRIENLPVFRETCKRRLLSCKDGVDDFLSQKVYALGKLPLSATLEVISAPAKLPRNYIFAKAK